MEFNKIDVARYIEKEMKVKRNGFKSTEEWEQFWNEVSSSKHFEYYIASIEFKLAFENFAAIFLSELVKYHLWIKGYFIVAGIALLLSIVIR